MSLPVQLKTLPGERKLMPDREGWVSLVGGTDPVYPAGALKRDQARRGPVEKSVFTIGCVSSICLKSVPELEVIDTCLTGESTGTVLTEPCLPNQTR